VKRACTKLDLGIDLLKEPTENLVNFQNLEAINFSNNLLGNENTSDLTFLTFLTNGINLNLMWFNQISSKVYCQINIGDFGRAL
jgi:hypothetical protein